jgi:hypothetical protein
VIEGLRGGRDESAYVRFHGCVYTTVGWLESERQMGRTVDAVSALTRLAAVWATDGPINHPFENYFDSAAEGMVRGNRHALAHLCADGRRRIAPMSMASA